MFLTFNFYHRFFLSLKPLLLCDLVIIFLNETTVLRIYIYKFFFAAINEIEASQPRIYLRKIFRKRFIASMSIIIAARKSGYFIFCNYLVVYLTMARAHLRMRCLYHPYASESLLINTQNNTGVSSACKT